MFYLLCFESKLKKVYDFERSIYCHYLNIKNFDKQITSNT